MNQIIDYSGYDDVERSILKVKIYIYVSNITAYLNLFSNKTEMYRKRTCVLQLFKFSF